MQGLEERLMSIVNKTNSCWIWTAGTNQKGYGQIKVNGKTKAAHRISYMIYKGEIGDLYVCHTCDNPPCINPDHLWLGTCKDNHQDREIKRRGKNSRKTHCPQGHEYNEKNTYYSKRGCRNCRVCDNEKQKKRYWDKRNEYIGQTA